MAGKIPKNECAWLDIRDCNGMRYLITSKIDDRSIYFLYLEQENGFTKLGKSRDPRELERKFVTYV